MNILFKIMTTVSFVGVVAIAGTGAYVYANKEAIIDNVKAQVMEAVTSSLPGALGGGVPEIPGAGSSAPVPSTPISLPGI